MSIPTDIPCPACGDLLFDERGIGEEKSILICHNPNCQGHFPEEKCPECGSAVNEVQTLILGDMVFHCVNAHTWLSKN